MEMNEQDAQSNRRPRRLKRSMTVYLRPAQHDALHALAEKEGESVALLVRRGVDKVLAEAAR